MTMTDTSQLPDADVVRILLEQHTRVRALLEEVATASGERKQPAFDELRELLAKHETAEELVLRPASKGAAGDAVVQARNEEEKEATHVLADLEKLDVTSAEFDEQFAGFRRSVEAHASAEEQQEFPAVVASVDAEERMRLGTKLRKAEAAGPTHPHPSSAGSHGAQMALGPFASLLDRARDALSRD